MSNGSKKSAHILVIPWPAPGHILPFIDLTHQLLIRGITITFLVTPNNQFYLNSLVSQHDQTTIQTLVLPLPFHPSLPAGVENMQDITQELALEMVAALSGLHDPVLQWFKSHPSPPVAILSDPFLNIWTHPLASTLGIKCIGFLPFSYYVASAVWKNYQVVTTESFFGEALHNTVKSWALVANSFTELDAKSLDFVKGLAGHDRVWGVAPLANVKATGLESSQSDPIIEWLDSCPVEKSVVYVAFGSEVTLNKQQMEALADALEKSGVRFIWAVKNPRKAVDNQGERNVVPSGFEDRVRGRGFVIRGWVPQPKILSHQAVGSYLTHCGWGSVLEGLLGGVLLLTWPMQGEHFITKKLLVDELGAAIPVCEGLAAIPDSVNLAQVLTDSLDQNRPERIVWMKLSEKASIAAKQGGSSYQALDDLATQIFNLN